jgi:RNA polymerase sigma-70 factor (ECF subfamily)
LIRRVRDPADAESWSEFVALYEPLLLGYVRERGLKEHDARDVVQNIFALLLRSLPTFELDHGRGRFRTWLWQVTRNAVADWARRENREATVREALRQLPPAAEEGPDAEWLTAHRQRVLDFVLEQVRRKAHERTWACFEGHLLHGRSCAVVAREVGVSVNAVCVNACRVLARVRERCAEYLEDLGDG